MKHPLFHRYKWQWMLFLLALCIRLIYVSRGYEVPPQDTADYDEIARNLLTGEGFVARENWHGFEVRSWRAPFYPFFLALVYGLFGYGHLVVKVVQSVLGAATVVLLYELGRKLDVRAALLGGLIAAVYGPMVASVNEVMTEAWFTFWLVLAAWLLAEIPLHPPRRAARAWKYLGAGMSLGLAVLTRPVGILFAPGLFVTAWSRRRPGEGYHAVWATLAMLFVLFPWTLRNYRVHGHWPVLSTHGGFILARSNSINPAWRQEHGWRFEKSTFERIPSEIERDRHWYRQGLAFIGEHPGLYVRWVGERFLHFWYFFRPEYNFWFMALLPFFLAGLYRFWKKGAFLFLTSGIVLSTGIFCFVLYGTTRFRLPLEPFFILFAASFLRELQDRWGSRRTWKWAGGVVGINLLIYGNDAALRSMLLKLLHTWQLK